MNKLEQWMAPKEVGSSLSPDANGILMYEPKGVTLILGPWNFFCSFDFRFFDLMIRFADVCTNRFNDFFFMGDDGI